MSASLQPLTFADLRGWADDDHAAALAAWKTTAARMLDKPYPARPLAADPAAMLAVAREGLAVDPGGARAFFESAFRPWQIDGAGFLTGYFEPVLEARRERSPGFHVPLLARPADLVEVADVGAPPDWPAALRFARQTPHGLEEHPDRGEIMEGALDGRGLEIAWLADPVDAFFVHVQGSARLEMPDGPVRVTYDGKSGQDYTSLGRVLCERLGVAPQAMTADVLADWMRANREALPQLLMQNRSYIFFRETPATGDGPIAAAKVPLTAGRSLAVDRTLHGFGSPIWIEAADPLPDEMAPLSRLTVAQDTGSAIVGPARADLFVGTGARAGHVAGRVRHAMRMVVLLPVQR